MVTFSRIEKNIEFWQYGVALRMTKFLIKKDKKKYIRLIETLKEGVPWKKALKEVYGVTPEQLTTAYGRAVGIPDLKP